MHTRWHVWYQQTLGGRGLLEAKSVVVLLKSMVHPPPPGDFLKASPYRPQVFCLGVHVKENPIIGPGNPLTHELHQHSILLTEPDMGRGQGLSPPPL